MTPNLRIHLLGDFRLLVDDQLLTSVNQRRQQALLAYLLLHRRAPQPRDYVAYHFWPDSTDGQAKTNLRKLFFELRKVFPQAAEVIFTDGQNLGWRQDASFTCDVAELEQALDALEQATAPGVAIVQRVLLLYQGELFPACYEEWLLPIRRALHDRVFNALTNAIRALEAQHEFPAALHATEHLLRLDPLHEPTYRQLMHLRILSGDRAGALRIYHECVTMLMQELEVSPAAETQALYQHLLNLDPLAIPLVTPVAAKRHDHLSLVGRKQEWHLLQEAWQQMGNRKPHLLTLWGEAGMGKTRLAEELLRWATLRPGTVAHGRAYAAEGALAYTPLIEWLRSEALRPLLTQLESVWQTELARLLPELLTAYPDLPPPAPMTEGWQRQRFHEALARAIFAAPAPRLLVLEDLQWCDGETLAWLRYLLRFDSHAHLLIVGTVRAEAIDDQHPLHELRTQLRRETQWSEVELTPLTCDETARLAGQLTTEDVTSWQTRLYHETEGNPLFVVEIVQAGLLAQWGSNQHQPPGPLPPTVQAVIDARLGQLSASARQLAQVAATIGRSFSVEVLAAASELSEDLLVQALDELWQRRIVREREQGYDFSHDKIREVAYESIAPMQRRRQHRQVARALEEVYQSDLAMVWGQLATHYEVAQMAERALPYWVLLAQRAESLDTYTDANLYYERGLALFDAHLPADFSGIFDLLFLRSALLERQNQFARLAQDIETMFTLAERMGDQDRLAKAHLRHAGSLGLQGDMGRALHAGEQALSIYQNRRDIPGAIHALRELGLICWSAQDNGNALRYGRQVLHLHRQQSDLLGEATALHNLAEIYRGLESPRQAITLYEQALQLYWGHRDHRRHALTLYGLAFAYRQIAQPEQALRYYQQAQASCEKAGDRLILSRVYHALAILYWEMQQPETALHAMSQAVAIIRDTGHLPSIAYSLLAQGYMAAQMGRRTVAQPLLVEALMSLELMGDQEGIGEVQRRLAALADGKANLPEPPATMSWIRSHVVLTEGKVYCEFELPNLWRRNV